MKNKKEYLNLFIGLILVSLAFNLFFVPYNISAGGISGLSLVINKVTKIDESLFIFISNIILLLISWIFLGKEQTKNTIIGSLLFPIFIFLTRKITNYISLTDLETILFAILGGILNGIGYGLIFKSGFTSGGTDVINQIMEKYLHMPIAKSILLVDGFVILMSTFVFGIVSMIYSFLALVLTSVFSNKEIIGIDHEKTIYIASTKYEQIKNYLHEELKIDSTDFAARGGYKKRKGKIILTVVDSNNYYRLKEAIHEIDPKAFIVVTSSYHIVNANKTIRM